MLNHVKQMVGVELPQRYFGETHLDKLMEDRLSPSSLIDFDLRAHFSPKSYLRLRSSLLKMTSINLEQWMHAPPMMTIGMIQEALLESHGPSADLLLWNHYKELDVTVDGLEPVDMQVRVLQSISVAEQVVQLKRILRRLSKTRRDLTRYIDLYKSQQIHKLYHLSRRSLGRSRKIMLNKRNAYMTHRIKEILKEEQQCVLITIGTAHLSGELGILHQLRIQDIDVQPVHL